MFNFHAFSHNLNSDPAMPLSDSDINSSAMLASDQSGPAFPDSSHEAFQAPPTQLDEPGHNEPIQIPSNIPVSGIASLSLEPTLSARFNTGVVDFPLPSSAKNPQPAEPSQVPIPDDPSDELGVGEMVEESRRPIDPRLSDGMDQTTPAFGLGQKRNREEHGSESNQNKVRVVQSESSSQSSYDLKKQVRDITRENTRLQKRVDVEVREREKMRISLTRVVDDLSARKDFACHQLDHVIERHNEEIRRKDVENEAHLEATRARHELTLQQLIAVSLEPERHSLIDPALELLERDRVSLTQRVSDMRAQYGEILQAERSRLSSELFLRHQNDEKTIAALHVELAEVPAKMKEERKKLEQSIREEKRAAEQQEALLTSEHAASSRKLREEISKLKMELQAVKDDLGGTQVELQERDFMVKTIERERDCLDSQLLEEIRKAGELSEKHSEALDVLRRECVELSKSLEEKNREFEEEESMVRALRDELKRLHSAFENTEVNTRTPLSEKAAGKQREIPSTPKIDTLRFKNFANNSNTSSRNSSVGPFFYRAPATPTPSLPRTGPSISPLTSSPLRPKSTRFQPHPPPSGEPRSVLLARIRTSMNERFGIKYDREIVTAVENGHLISDEDNNMFEQYGAANVMEDLSVSFLQPFWGNIRCEYNRLLAALFSESFVHQHPKNTLDVEFITEQFLERLQRLKYRYLSGRIAFDEAGNDDDDDDDDEEEDDDDKDEEHEEEEDCEV